jgi:hypothetical protein
MKFIEIFTGDEFERRSKREMDEWIDKTTEEMITRMDPWELHDALKAHRQYRHRHPIKYHMPRLRTNLTLWWFGLRRIKLRADCYVLDLYDPERIGKWPYKKRVLEARRRLEEDE